GNIQCLDVLRALAREPETGAALLAELNAASGVDDDFDAALATLRDALSADTPEAGARHLVERMSLLLQASVLLRARNPLAATFCRSRLGGRHGLAFGTLPAATDFGLLIERAGSFG
ncbi:MAG TPA: DNA alkylation response protein, partial [Luteimonas sp.]|nr:DNA alkylation response protein [Luteimonas sp.]